MQFTWFEEVKDALFAGIDELTKIAWELKKASEEYHFPDEDVVSWRVSHDFCIMM
jgi:hypothetical protein